MVVEIKQRFERKDGSDCEIKIVRGVVFTDYETAGLKGKLASLTVEDGVIVGSVDMPEELTTPDEARSWAALLIAAADELEKQAK